MHKAWILGSIATLGIAGTAFAADDSSFSYTYLEGSYLHAQSFDLDGWQAKGSYGFTPNISGFASYTANHFAGQPSGLGNDKQYQVGVGLNQALSANLDIIGTVAYARNEPDFASNESGVAASARLRGRLAPNFELEGGVDYIKLKEIDSDTSVDLTARYFFTPAFALGGGVNLDNGVDTYMITLRYDFAGAVKR